METYRQPSLAEIKHTLCYTFLPLHCTVPRILINFTHFLYSVLCYLVWSQNVLKPDTGLKAEFSDGDV